MKLNTNLIIGTALIGGGAYYAYKKGWFGSKKDNAKKAEEQSKAELDRIAAEQAATKKAVVVEQKAVSQVKQATNILNPKSFAGKVADIQRALGIKEDGDAGKTAGSQTNMKYAAVYGLDKGIISTSNIDYYKSKVDNRLTLVAQKAAQLAAAKKAATQVNVANDAKKFLELVNNGKYKATLTKDVVANAYTFDRLKNVYVDIKESKKFTKGMVFQSKGYFYDTKIFSKSPRGGYVMFYNQGNPNSTKLYALNPADFLVTL